MRNAIEMFLGLIGFYVLIYASLNGGELPHLFPRQQEQCDKWETDPVTFGPIYRGEGDCHEPA